MGIDRRTRLAFAAAMMGLVVLNGEAAAQGEAKSEAPKGVVTLTASLKAKPGQEDAVKEALLSLVEPTRKEPGCLHYILHQSKTDPTLFMFYEQWEGQEALDAHGKSPHMKALGAKLKDKTDKGGGVVKYDLLK
ncbi:putative quinol monooxygenase [Paludisphaera mucosa]|uniref:Quinol monooxygenase n=1 Tax=Paludisphaera mucosa TaxID=3030827 RepID=A0ABT6F4N2_9BACT|nr:putative quinol monooxygenase [Paludisphaera mucosa]MDG3002398.1 putative quinol monooxygenase [Paludisphaera mucosa]